MGSVTSRMLANWMRARMPRWGSEDGILCGDSRQEIKGVLVTWMADVAAIQRAAKKKCNLIVAHEDPWFSPDYAFDVNGDRSGVVNARRKELLDQSGICLMRAHGALDGFCILEDGIVATVSGEIILQEDWWRVVRIEPARLGAIAAKLKARWRGEELRLLGNPNRKVKVVGFPWGGMSLSVNAQFLKRFFEIPTDLLIAGEMDEYAVRACQDVGVAVIELGHARSECPGLRHFARILSREFHGLKVHFFDSAVALRSI